MIIKPAPIIRWSRRKPLHCRVVFQLAQVRKSLLESALANFNCQAARVDAIKVRAAWKSDNACRHFEYLGQLVFGPEGMEDHGTRQTVASVHFNIITAGEQGPVNSDDFGRSHIPDFRRVHILKCGKYCCVLVHMILVSGVH